MNTKQVKEFLTAVDSMVKEKGIDKQIVIEAMEQAMVAAFKKKTGNPNGRCKVNEDTGEHVFTETFEEHENTMIGGADIDGDGIPDEGAGSDVEDNNAASDVWSNKEDDE